MADAEAARGAREAPVGDQRHAVAHALAIDGGGRGQHLAHAGSAARPLVADHDNIARLVAALIDRREGVFLAIEAKRRTGEAQILHAGDLHDRALRREVAS